MSMFGSWLGCVCRVLIHLGRCYARATLEGLPGVLENKEILTKYRREHEPTFREQGNRTLIIRGRKQGKQIY